MESGTPPSRLGTTAHLSPILVKARRLGFADAQDLERLAVSRGLRYYDGHGDSRIECNPSSTSPQNGADGELSNEELAIALLSPAAPYSQQRIRIGAAMLAADGNQPESLADLALRERTGSIVRYIAECGHDVEPENPFWDELLELLPAGDSAPPAGILPHPTRFVAMTGITRAGVGTIKQWIRPRIQQPA